MSFFKKVWLRKELLYYFIRTDLKKLYASKILGYVWSLLDPLAQMVVYTILIKYIFHRGGEQFPALLFSVLLSWKWFASSASLSAVIFNSRAKTILTVDFPKAILPLSVVFSNMFRYLLGMLTLIPILFWFDAKFTLNILWYPIIFFFQLLLTIGTSLLLSICGTYLKDLENILVFSLRIVFYLSPAMYFASHIPDQYRFYYMLNPFAAYFESYKAIFVLGLAPSPFMIPAAIMSLIVFVMGIAVFNKHEYLVSREL